MLGMRRKGTSAAVAAVFALGLASACGAAQAALTCAQLTSVTPEASTITAARWAGPGDG